MQKKLEWLHHLNIEYSNSTFDTDPFEPQPCGVRTIFPFLVHGDGPSSTYVELPYTLPQDHNLFIILRETDNSIWKRKLDWIAEKGGMAFLNTHPDYMNFDSRKNGPEEYPAAYYLDLLNYVKERYQGQYWNALPREIASFWLTAMAATP
jgi:hypothetical protein